METNTKEKQAKALERYLPKIQSWMETNVTGQNGKGVPGKVVFEALKEELGFKMQENSFCVGLSLNVKFGNIKGFSGRQGPSGGYFPETKLTELKLQKSSKPKRVKTVLTNKVDLGHGMYLTSSADGSWSFVKPSGPKVKSKSLKKTLEKVAALLSEDDANDPGLEIISKISSAVDGSEVNVAEKLQKLVSGL